MIINAEKGVTNFIGRLGENEARVMRFPVRETLCNFPGCTFMLLNKRPGDSSAYPSPNIEVRGNYLYWTVTSGDLVRVGFGEVEVTATVDSKVVKDDIYQTEVKTALDGSGTVPDPWQGWVTQITNAADRADEAVEHYPRIVEGIWTVWDVENEQWVSTGIHAEGQPGDPGQPGADGVSPVASVSKVGKVSTLTVTDASGTTSVEIHDGEDGAGADLIDDTAGEGDTDKVWSANKTDTEVKDLKSQIETKLEAPETAGTSGQVLVSDGNGGQVWGTTGSGTITVDSTLSVEGAAADSKKAGDVIRSFSETTRNLFDDTIFATANDISVGIDGFYYGKSSKWVADFSSGLPFDTSFKSNTRYTISVRYYISNVATYTGSISAIKVYYTDGTSGNAIGFNASNTNEKYETVTTSANKTIDYISIALVDGRGNDYIVHLKELQIEEGTSASYFIKHRTACDVIARSTASSLEKTTSALEKQIDVIDLNWELGYIKTSDGTNQNASVCIRSTDFILLNQGDKIYMDYDYMSRLYRYSSEDLSTFQAYYDYNYDSTLHYITGYYEIPVTGYYRIVVSDYVQSTIPSTDIAVVSNKIHLIRNSAINDLKGDVSLNILPYNLTALKTYIDSLNNTKGDLMIPIVTDIHGGYQDTYPVINYLANSGIGNYFFELGDVINSTFATRADSIAYLRESFHSMAYTKTNTPIIMLQGNHDTNPLSGTDTTKNVTQEVFYNLSMARARGLHQPTNKAYGYVDIEEAKVRVIWLNTSDIFDATTGNALVTGQYTMIQQAQVQWFTDIALDFTDKNTPTDWSVIIMSHDSLSQVASSAFANILTAFMNGTSYSGTQTVSVGTYSNVINYSCDFTQQGELTVICEVNGHHHKDMIRELGTTGIKQVYVACEGNASACYDNNGETAYYTRRRGTSDEHLIDTLVLDKTNRKVYFKRFGVGEDREISY